MVAMKNEIYKLDQRLSKSFDNAFTSPIHSSSQVRDEVLRRSIEESGSMLITFHLMFSAAGLVAQKMSSTTLNLINLRLSHPIGYLDITFICRYFSDFKWNEE